jgi:hypothetical protein
MILFGAVGVWSALSPIKVIGEGPERGEGAMRRLLRSMVAVVAPIAVMTALVVGAWGAPAAQAYGRDHVYQLTFSLNCNDKHSDLCSPDQFGLGGVWGWIEADSDGTADATITFCSHDPTMGIGAHHENLDEVPWSIVPESELNGRFAVGTDPTGMYIVFDSTSDLGFIAFPVTPGHYSVTFGHGIRANGTVVKMH